jgi:hypothetical protein
MALESTTLHVHFSRDPTNGKKPISNKRTSFLSNRRDMKSQLPPMYFTAVPVSRPFLLPEPIRMNFLFPRTRIQSSITVRQLRIRYRFLALMIIYITGTDIDNGTVSRFVPARHRLSKLAQRNEQNFTAHSDSASWTGRRLMIVGERLGENGFSWPGD